MAKSTISTVLKPELVKMHLEATTKEDAIRELVGILDSASLLADPAEAERVVLEREKVMSTGLEYGIAIPHGKTDTVDGLLVAMALKAEGIEFECADSQPARILIVTLSPASSAGPHIRFMAEVTRMLRRDDLRQQVLEAATPREVVELLAGK